MLKKIRRRKEKAVTNIPIPTVSFVMKYFSKSVPQTRVPEGGEAGSNVGSQARSHAYQYGLSEAGI